LIERRQLGSTAMNVTRLALGGLFISDLGGNGASGASAIVKKAAALGLNYIDTAPAYGDSEVVLGEAFGHLDKFYVSTKLGGRPTPFDPKNRASLRESFEESLRLLRREYIDILFVHEPDRPGQYDWWDDYDSFYGPVSDVLADLKGSGLVRYTGVGGTTAYELARLVATGAYDVVLSAFNYSLLWTEADIELLPEAKRQNMGVIAGSPLQGGALARRYEEVKGGAPWLSPPRRRQFLDLYDLLDNLDMSISEVGLRFVMSNEDIDVVLTGARSVDELTANVAAAERGKLPEAVLDDLRAITRSVPFRPFEEPGLLPFGRLYRGPGPLQ